MRTKAYNNATVTSAHSVRTLRVCVHCRGIGNAGGMLKMDKKVFMHGRCWIKKYGLKALLALPQSETDKLSRSDIGVQATKALLARRKPKRVKPVYVPCMGSDDSKHKFERIKHNQFEKCMNCGEPRFALLARN